MAKRQSEDKRKQKAERIAELQRRRLVAVIRSKDEAAAVQIAEAAAEGGVRFVEITFSVPGALGIIEKLARRGDLHIAAGTVLSKEEARRAISAGAQMIVSPTLELDLIPVCRKAGVPCVSGAATPTEILTAARAGADLVKIFPADCLGGPDFIRQMMGPFPDVKFVMSGGLSLNNIKEYVTLGVVGLSISSAYLSGYFQREGRAELVRHVGEFVKLVEEAMNG